MNWLRLLLILLMFLPGCVSPNKADKLTYDAIAPEYLGYVEKDASLDEKQKERRRETVRSWEARAKRGEE
jgi:hypothetical protein